MSELKELRTHLNPSQESIFHRADSHAAVESGIVLICPLRGEQFFGTIESAKGSDQVGNRHVSAWSIDPDGQTRWLSLGGGTAVLTVDQILSRTKR